MDSENTGFVDRGEVCSCILQQLEEKDAKTTSNLRPPVQQPPKFGQSLYSKVSAGILLQNIKSVLRGWYLVSYATHFVPCYSGGYVQANESLKTVFDSEQGKDLDAA